MVSDLAAAGAVPESRRPIRVLLVDDSQLFLQGLASLLREVPSIELVGLAENGAEAVKQAAQLLPDVVLMDVHMPVQGGVSAATVMTERLGGVAIVLISGLWGGRRQDVPAGVHDVLSKDVGVEAIVEALTEAAHAGAHPARVRPRDADRRAGDRLTRREVAILSMLAKGYHSQRIADELRLKQKTVRNYISVIYDKIGVRGRSRAVLYAARSGLLDETT